MGKRNIICVYDNSKFYSCFDDLGAKFYLCDKKYSKTFKKEYLEELFSWYMKDNMQFLVQSFEGENNEIYFYLGLTDELIKYKYSLGTKVIADSKLNELIECKRFAMKDCTFEKNYIRNNKTSVGSFIVGEDAKSIYLPKKDTMTRPFSKIFYDDSSLLQKEFQMENILLVQETFSYNQGNGDIPTICDEIIYGIDPTTLEIKTKIYSKVQERFIDLYTDEEIKKARFIYPYEKTKYIKFKYLDIDQRGSDTIYYSIIVPLERKIEKELKNNKNPFNIVDRTFIKQIKR